MFDNNGILLTEAQEKFFKDSVIKDSEGNLLEVYHGTIAEFEEFEGGGFFTDDYWNADGYASGEIVHSVYLNVKNPLIIDCEGQKWDQLDTEFGTSTREIIATVDKQKYDGVVFENINDSWIDDEAKPCTVYYAFEPNQVKSIDNFYPTYDNNFLDNEEDYFKHKVFEDLEDIDSLPSLDEVLSKVVVPESIKVEEPKMLEEIAL